MTQPLTQQPHTAATDAASKFCPNCGVPLGAMPCRTCGAQLSAGARFCHRCGATAATGPGPRRSDARFAGAIPWSVAAIALLAFIGLAASQRFGGAGPSDAIGAATPQSGIVPAPDISSLTPSQRAERLYDRVMAAAERGRADSVQFFMPMAIGAYQALGDLSLDQRYDLGRLAEVAGDARLATAQADTILRRQPQHLLGLILAARAAELRGDARAARQYQDRLARNERAERQKQLPEYLVHQNDIDAALRQGGVQGSATRP